MIHVPTTPYKKKEGDYGFLSKNGDLQWSKCREVFHNKYLGPYSADGFFYSASNDISKLIFRVESYLKIKFSQIYDTDEANVFYIIPTSFWKSQHTRISFFSILVRAANTFKSTKKHWLSHLVDEPYFNSTLPAFLKFIDGFNFSLTNRSWVSVFSDGRNSHLLEKPCWWRHPILTLKVFFESYF